MGNSVTHLLNNSMQTFMEENYEDTFWDSEGRAKKATGSLQCFLAESIDHTISNNKYSGG